MKEAAKTTKNNAMEIWDFTQQLVKILFALSIVCLGAYAVFIGKIETHMLIKQIALIVSGICTVLSGTALEFKTIMRK